MREDELSERTEGEETVRRVEREVLWAREEVGKKSG